MDIVDTTSSSDRYIKSIEEVNTFLNQVKVCLDDDVAEVIRELQIANYCYTADDRNANFPNETFWFFGITRYIIDSEEKLYIKLKIRRFEDEILLVMSFHPEQPSDPDNELTFPYAK